MDLIFSKMVTNTSVNTDMEILMDLASIDGQMETHMLESLKTV